jgi:hypothetical protein
MMITRVGLGFVCGLFALSAQGAPKAEDLERFLYVWSASAEIIVEGSIAAFESVDDPLARSPFIEATIRINSVQRGDPKSGTIRVRIEDPLQISMWGEQTTEIGARGMWFIHRVRASSGEVPVGSLIRYVSAHEIASDPVAADTLMRYVVQETIDQAVEKDILRALEPNPKGSKQTVDLRLKYDKAGRLTDLEVVRNSGNLLYDQHVFDKVAALHRTVQLSIPVAEIDVQVTRAQASVDERKQRRAGVARARVAVGDARR